MRLGYDPTSGADIVGSGVEALGGSIEEFDKRNDVTQSNVIVDTGPWMAGLRDGDDVR